MSRSTLPSLLEGELGRSALMWGMRREFGELLDTLNRGLGMPHLPTIDVSETADGVRIEAELPGVTREDVDLTVSGGTLTIAGTKSAREEREEEGAVIVERSRGSFRRDVPLGFEPEGDAIETAFGDGVLTVSIRRPEGDANGRRKIEVKAA